MNKPFSRQFYLYMMDVFLNYNPSKTLVNFIVHARLL